MRHETHNTRKNIAFIPHQTSFSREGCELIGWSDKNHRTDKVPQYPIGKLIEDGFPSDVDLYAIWGNNLVTVKFIANGGTEVPDAQVPTYTLFGDIPHSTSRLGYSLVNWFTDFFGGQVIQNDFIVMNDLIAYARWKAITYGIAYNVNGHGEQKAYGPTSYTIESEDIVPTSNPVSTGWKFTGWTPSSIPKGSTGDVTFNANW